MLFYRYYLTDIISRLSKLRYKMKTELGYFIGNHYDFTFYRSLHENLFAYSNYSDLVLD